MKMFEVMPELRSVLEREGLDGLDPVFAWDRGERLDKPGLETWRQRWRVSFRVGGEHQTFYLTCSLCYK